MTPKSRKCIFLGYGELGEMGFRLWDPKSKKIVCNHDGFFDKGKMHKKPVKLVEIWRVVFREDDPLPSDPQVGGQRNIPQANKQG